jgi:fumarylpyruvate hydrolase
VELVVAIGKGGNDISAARAAESIWGYAVGLDMTRRDLQAEAKKSGRPWCTAKAFDYSAPIGELHAASSTGAMVKGAITLDVNGERRQTGDLSQMIWNVSETIEHLSRYFTLQPGDLIFTGTPAGVGPVHKGDLLEGQIEGMSSLKVKMV